MKKILLAVFLSFNISLMAQSDYRFTGTYQGKTEAGLRVIKLDIQRLSGGKWKWVHRGVITTGRNLDLAKVETDSMYSARSWQDVQNDTELKDLYLHYMETYLDRIDATDLTKINTSVNNTNNTISIDNKGIITIQVRGIQDDKTAYIDLVSLDNHYYVMYNKEIRQYSLSLIELTTSKMQAADYIVVCTPNKGEKFSEKISVK